MGFQRKIINQTSTFTTGNEVVPVSTPTFKVWENTTNTGEHIWDLGNKWQVLSGSTDTDLKFQRDGNVVFKITSSGFEGALNLNALKLESWTTLPSANQYDFGDLVKSDGNIYMATEGE
tara:strand:+ start:2259 stop:2615 length:357 start_codon:yes stop_codon:yes gene_type:complete